MNINFKLMIFITVLGFQLGCGESDTGPSPISSNGEAGSTARFAIQNDHLITLEDDYLQVFSLTNPTEPELTNSYYTGGGLVLETIYLYEENRILLGTNQGAIIMDHSNPGTLLEIAFAGHTTSCDPVIANGNYMYVTLRNGRDCGVIMNTEGVNQLLVFDISDIANPVLVKTMPLDQPWGLGIKDQALFVCVDNGVMKLDITNPEDPIEIQTYSAQCNDIIASDPMILTGDDGIRLVEDSGVGLTELSFIGQGS